MFDGGIADKLGNEYEKKWAVRMVLQVIASKANSIRYEGLSEEFLGLEFVLIRSNCAEWHQVKINASHSNWTLIALKGEGVINAFKKRLLHDASSKCVFVSQDPAKQMRTLCEKSQIANNANEFLREISKKDKDTFDTLVETWDTNEKTAFEWLRRCEFRTESSQSIDEAIASHGDHLFKSDVDPYVILSNYLINNLNALLTTEDIRKWLRKNHSFTFRSASLDPTLREEIDRANQRYLCSYTPFGLADQQIARAEATTVFESLRAVDGPSLVLLTGEAGSGKSGVAREIMDNLKTCEIPHLAFRIDLYLSCRTGKEIGNDVIDRSESPVSVLANLTEDGTAILIIDQIDAVSEITGRTGAVKETLFELIRETQHYGNVRCLLVCRNFDLENDSRYRDLEQKQNTKRVKVPLLTWEQEVVPVLEHAGIETGNFTEGQKKLLTLPLNLSIFLEIDDPAFGFSTRTALMQKLLEKKTLNLQKSPDLHWSILNPLSNIAQWMSDHQTLSCPDYVLDHFDGAQNWLSSEGLIVITRNKLAFFHESFFDFIFARTFARSGYEILNFLTSTEQHLFRRTQVRQILTLMRDTDRSRYLETLKTVLIDSRIRLHVKYAVAQWLSILNNPTQQELEIIVLLDDDDEEFPALMRRALFVSEFWFSLLDRNGQLSEMLETTKQARLHCLLWWLSSIVNKDPRPVSRLMKDWWNHDSRRDRQLAKWFSSIHQMPEDRELVLLLRDIVRSAPGDVLLEDRGRRVTLLLPDICTAEPNISAEILQAFFVHWFEQNPGEHLFSHLGAGSIDILDLENLGKQAPIAFLDGMIPALVKSINIASDGNSDNGRIHVLYRTKSGRGPNALFSLYRDALHTLAKTSPSEAGIRLDQLEPTSHKILLHLHLEAINANPVALGYRLVALLDDQNLFSAGLEGAEWKSFAKVARSVLKVEVLSIPDTKKIEEKVLNHRPEHDWVRAILRNIRKQGEIEPSQTQADALMALARSGHIEWCVLKTIGQDLLSSDGKKRLTELERKFCVEMIPAPQVIEASFVDSPIPSNVARGMTDRQWLSAIDKYAGDYTPMSFKEPLVGGASELARELGNCTKTDPGRFARLFLHLPDDANPVYGRLLLEGLAYAELVDKNAVIQALHAAHAYRSQPFGLQITRIIKRHPACTQDDSIFKSLLWHAEYGEIDEPPMLSNREDGTEFPTIDDLININVRLLIDSRINSARGVAWDVLGNLVPNNPYRVPAIWKLVERRVNEELSAPVRAMMLGTLVSLFNDDRDRFEANLRCLVQPISNDPNEVMALSPLVTHTGVHLFPFIERDFPEFALTLMKRMIDSSDRNLQLIGAWWALCERLRHGNSTSQFQDVHQKSPAHTKLWATILCGFATEAEFRDMATSELITLFSHEILEVRRAAADVFEHISSDDYPYFIEVAQAFNRSPALATCAYPFIQALKKTTCDVTELVIETGRNLVNNEKVTGTGFEHELRGILKREYVNSENRPELRTKLLNLIDYMIEKNSPSANELMQIGDR